VRISGEVIELWRYPVKSMLGESCEEIELDARGVAGDRLYAVQDTNGKFGSGKDTRHFRKIDGLFLFRAHFHDQIPQVRFPDGKLISGNDPAINGALSDALGQPVQLVREAAISHLDEGPIHIVTRAALASFQGIAPESTVDARRFRPNIVLSTSNGPPEQTWQGKRARIGDAEIKFSSHTERCGMVAFPQSELLKAPQILRHITQELGLKFGLYAEVVKPGVIKLGDGILEVVDDI